jgi:hypothetical protein
MLLLRRGKCSTHADEPDPRVLPTNARDSLEKNMELLPRHVAPNVQNLWRVENRRPHHAFAGCVSHWIVSCRENGMLGQRNYRYAVCWREALRNDLVSDGVAVTDDARGGCETGKDVARHSTKQCGARLGSGIQKTAKRVEVVAGNDCPAGGQMVYQLAVAVIKNVKEIEPVANVAQMARIVNEAIQQAIGVEGVAGVAAAREAPNHGRLHSHRRDKARVTRVQGV